MIPPPATPDGTVDRDAPTWPPLLGQAVTIYLATSDDPEHAHHASVVELVGDDVVIEPSGSLEGVRPARGTATKLLFPGNRFGWGFDADVVAVERLPSRAWTLRLRRGPVVIERRESARVATRTIVIVRSRSLTAPALMLDRSDHGMRLLAGRAARLHDGQHVEVEVSADETIAAAEIVWQRHDDAGVELGVRF